MCGQARSSCFMTAALGGAERPPPCIGCCPSSVGAAYTF
jgi:hypothetical protein